MLTNKKAKVLGFYGIEIYDIIIYSSLLISNMGKKVLVIDNSDNKALSHCIVLPKNMEDKDTIIEYRGLDYSLDNNFLKYINDYDYIFVDYGFNSNSNDFYYVDEIIYVADMQYHNIKRILDTSNSNKSNKYHLIIRDLCKKESVNYIIELFFDNLIDISSYVLLEDDYADKRKRSSLQFSKRPNYRVLSYNIQSAIENILIRILSINRDEFNNIYKKMKRGA